ncbi:hypothetical protein Agub_g9641, partial [Astrephomene gubernaculifera]
STAPADAPAGATAAQCAGQPPSATTATTAVTVLIPPVSAHAVPSLEALLGRQQIPTQSQDPPLQKQQSRLQLPESHESYGTWRLDDKALEAQLVTATSALYERMAEDAAWLQKQLGNSYTASLWQGLAALVYRRGGQLAGRRLLLFSFGSGTVAALFSLVARGGGGAAGGGGAGGGGAGSSAGREDSRCGASAGVKDAQVEHRDNGA